MKRCYVAGKISNLPVEVFRENFAIARSEVQTLGMIAICPTLLAHDHDKSWESYMKETLISMLKCDCVYVQRNWHESRGAIIEVNLAIELGFDIIYQPA